jgi:sugar lactone lactonase YvrE
VSTDALERVGDFGLRWGESLRWDDRRKRLYFVDCVTQQLHWLDGGEPPLQSLRLPGLPTGVLLTEGSELVVCLDEGLTIIDPDSGRLELLAPYPDGLHGRANDAGGDGSGNLVTGTLNLAPGPGALWWFSAAAGWRLLDNDNGNTNGPVVVDFDGEQTLVVGDTVAGLVYAYPFDSAAGSVGQRRVLADYSTLEGAPDGATVDADGAIWSCVFRAGKLVRLTSDGIDVVLDVPTPYPSDVAFGGPSLDHLYLTSIAIDIGDGPPDEQARWLAVVNGMAGGFTGVPEPRFRL